MELFQTVSTLNQPCGPTGFEGPAARAAAELLRPWVDELEINATNTVVGVKHCGRENAPKIMLDAHLDEVGMIVSGYEEGFLRFFTLGGIDPRVLPNRQVTVLTQPPLFGIVTTAAPGMDADKAVPMKELYIDVGLSQSEAEERIPVGTPVSYKEGCYALEGGRVAGKSMDDRACFALLVETMKLLADTSLDADVYVVGSSREETDSTGAITTAYRIQPDYAVAVDVTFGKTLDASDEGFELGCGPIIGCGPNIANWMFQRMKEKASALDLHYEVEVMAGSTGTNGWDIQVSREGIATAILSIPLRYMHTPLEVIQLSDITASARLLTAFVRDIGKEAPAEC